MKSPLHFGRKKRRKGDTQQLAAQLAPLEEQDPHFGTIIVDKDDLKLPAEISETQDEKHFLGLEPVVLVVLILMLSFIAFITWQISLMPAR